MKWIYSGAIAWFAAFVWLLMPVEAQQWRYTATLADLTVAGTATGVFCTIGAATCANVQAGNGHVQASQASCALTGANIRITWDGTAATTSVGEVLTPGIWIFSGPDVLTNLQAIRDDATSATLSCVIYGT